MGEKSYHHGNLKTELIEKGLMLIDKHGVANLSMRKLAETCGVSSAAPYTHFRNKEDFLICVQQFITDQFTDTLKECVESEKNREKILLELGKRYVLFFLENPLYYHFLFFHGRITLEEYPPYQLFEGVSEDYFSKMGYKNKIMKEKTLALWSMVHGLAGLATMDGVLDHKHLEKEIEGILSAVSF